MTVDKITNSPFHIGLPTFDERKMSLAKNKLNESESSNVALLGKTTPQRTMIGADAWAQIYTALVDYKIINSPSK